MDFHHGDDEEEKHCNEKKRYTRIRIKNVEYNQRPATAVYFDDQSKVVEIMGLEAKVMRQKSEAANMESYTSMMSHEFRTPLSTAIMLLGAVFKIVSDKNACRILNMVT